MAEDYSRYLHPDKRLNNPPVGLATPDTDGVEEKAKYAYDPHIAPSLDFDSGRSVVENLLHDALPPPLPKNEEEREEAKREREALKAALKALDEALPSEQAEALKARLERLDRLEDAINALHAVQAPFLNWTGKAERTSFEVPTVQEGHRHLRRTRTEGGTGYPELSGRRASRLTSRLPGHHGLAREVWPDGPGRP
jgi:adenine-specific DNA-methyltransferase